MKLRKKTNLLASWWASLTALERWIFLSRARPAELTLGDVRQVRADVEAWEKLQKKARSS